MKSNWTLFVILVVFSQFVASNVLPRWLEVLLTEKFYNACIIHEEAKKNEKNVYCLDCCISLCPHCLSPHHSHRLLQVFLTKSNLLFETSQLVFWKERPFFIRLNLILNFCVVFQIRRYVYHDVIRLDDAAKLIDCAFVQVSKILGK